MPGKRHKPPQISLFGESEVKTWHRCVRCNQFIMFTGYEWQHRNGLVRCKGGNAKPKENYDVAA
jgi:hypothetical protein